MYLENFKLVAISGFEGTHHIPDDTSIEPCESEVVITPSQKRAGSSVSSKQFLHRVIEKSLGKFVDEKKAAVLRDKHLLKELVYQWNKQLHVPYDIVAIFMRCWEDILILYGVAYGALFYL
ncbi:hypothetical protein L6452_21942 [Arctium lappa]|uniref:Uncharacterized protein n=1 Tax=Arctium lappa TaxID=4217 RepID=A0ACB9AY14_ARCLA|nr:hypothetical protein L6452_21942 [Arctium lappa]